VALFGKGVATPLERKVHARSARAKAKQCGLKMKHHRFRADPMTSRLQQMTTILGMIDDLNRTGRLLEFDIERCPDRSTHASLTKRRTKLQETVGALEARLALLRHDKSALA
jgi:hypothetical protein